jgi:hypothetical protein
MYSSCAECLSYYHTTEEELARTLTMLKVTTFSNETCP